MVATIIRESSKHEPASWQADGGLTEVSRECHVRRHRYLQRPISPVAPAAAELQPIRSNPIYRIR